MKIKQNIQKAEEITVLICTNNVEAKQIYLDSKHIRYINMLSGVTYEQTVNKIEELESPKPH